MLRWSEPETSHSDRGLASGSVTQSSCPFPAQSCALGQAQSKKACCCNDASRLLIGARLSAIGRMALRDKPLGSYCTALTCRKCVAPRT